MKMTMSPPLVRGALAAASLVALSACTSLAPHQSPTAPAATAYLEPAPGWMNAAPADTLARGPWWALFGDPVLDQLAPQVAVSNQTVAAAAAAVAESRAAVRAQRASFFPSLALDVTATRSHTPTSTSTSHDVGLAASWTPDLWGGTGDSVSAAVASAQASEADLAAALLTAQTTFVTDYLSVREADDEIALLKSTIEAYQRSLTITRNRYAAAIAQRSDVLQAQTTLASAQASLSALVLQRAQLLHAMAVLAGQAPSNFALPPGDWHSSVVPAVPVGVPSELLQRRPDIASAERAVAAANAKIGVARAAYYPTLTLSADAGPNSTRLNQLFKVSQFAWSLGATLAETLFDGGARDAAVDEARATWDQSVAQYRQTVLTAFGSIEDQLSAAASYEQQEAYYRAASQAADQTETEAQNRYKQGTIAYTDVVTAQASALSARRSLIQMTLSRQTAAVSLISGLGGGWSTQQLTSDAKTR